MSVSERIEQRPPAGQPLSELEQRHVLSAFSQGLSSRDGCMIVDKIVHEKLTATAQILLGVVNDDLARLLAEPRSEKPPVTASRRELGTGTLPHIPTSCRTVTLHDARAAAAMFVVAAVPVISNCLARHAVADAEATAMFLVQSVGMGWVETVVEIRDQPRIAAVRAHYQDERRWMARQLHDVAAHAVALGLQQIELSAAMWDSDPAESRHRLHTARESLLEAFRAIRSVTARTRGTIVSGSFVEAVERYSKTLPPTIRFSMTVEGSLSRLSEPCVGELYLITAEAIRNSVTHAAPTTIDVTATLRRNTFVVEVVDNGRGFDPLANRDHPQHFGLDSMRERATVLDGQVDIWSSIGTGTTVRVEIDLADHPEHVAATAQAL